MSYIAIATEVKYTLGKVEPPYDDQVLQTALKELGHRVEIFAWDNWENAGIDLQQFNSIYVSSTWNACDDPSKFAKWLNACEGDRKRRLINDRAVLDAGFLKYRYWHMLEQFLQSNPALQKLGQLTPSRFYIDGDAIEGGRVESLATRRLAEVLAELDRDPLWTDSNIVLKPVISADGRDTFVYNRFKRAIPIGRNYRIPSPL